MARKARNRLSSAQLTVPAPDGTDGGGRSHKRRPTVNRRPSPSRVPEEDEKDNKEAEVKVEKGKEVKVEVKIAKDEVEGKPPPQLVVPTKVGALALMCYNFFRSVVFVL